MKVYIGPYDFWFKPYTWLKRGLMRWYGLSKKEGPETWRAHEEFESKIFAWFYYLNRLENWINNLVPRTVKIRIDRYDTWGMDDTLGLIILPMLKQLKATKHGSPSVDDDDVPDELKSTNATPALTPEQLAMGEIDGNFQQRWEWVLGEMIWAFEQINDPDVDDKFHYDLDPAKPRHAPGLSFQETMQRGGFDKDGYMEWQNRKTRGLLLFGKYYEGLWD